MRKCRPRLVGNRDMRDFRDALDPSVEIATATPCGMMDPTLADGRPIGSGQTDDDCPVSTTEGFFSDQSVTS